MANTQLQNSQRAILFLELILIIVTTIFIIVKIMRKQMDYNRAVKYEQSQKRVAQQSIEQFAVEALTATVIVEEDDCSTRAIKKFYEFVVIYQPILIVFPLNLITGTSYWFLLLIFAISVTAAFLINVYKIHRLCIDHIAARFFFQNIWLAAAIVMLINVLVFADGASLMPYIIIQK